MSAAALWNWPRGMHAISRNASRARFCSLSPRARQRSRSAPGSRFLRDDGRRQTFRIVGEDEADPRAGSIAYVSPLAHHLIGKQVGEAVEMDGHEIEIVAVQ